MIPGQTSLVLASSSPRRRELLAGLGLPFDVLHPGDEEQPCSGEVPAAYALRSATGKGLDVLVRHADAVAGRLLLAADTIVTLEGHILGKPADEAEAFRMLSQLSGRIHQVMTGLFLCRAREGLNWDITGEVVASRVLFHDLSPDRIRAYIATGETADKAGAYAIQGHGGELVKAYEGSWSNIVGLPLERLAELLRSHYGMAPPGPPASA